MSFRSVFRIPFASAAALAAAALLAPVPLGPLSALAEEPDAQAATIEEGRKVYIEYTLKTGDGTVADSNVGGDAFVYEQGGQQILPALEAALEGMEPGDEKEVTLPPAEGYGEVNPELIRTVPASTVPEDARTVGAQLMAENAAGEKRPVQVREVKDEEIVLDLNHPLAGQTLHFDVKVLEVE